MYNGKIVGDDFSAGLLATFSNTPWGGHDKGVRKAAISSLKLFGESRELVGASENTEARSRSLCEVWDVEHASSVGFP